MGAKTLILTFFVELGIAFETILNGSLDYLFGIDKAVGFGNDFAVDAAWLVTRRGAVVFGGLRHGLDLCFVEPFFQTFIVSDDASRNEMMGVAAFAKSCVVVCCNGIYHIGIRIVMLCKGEAAANHVVGMVALVSGIEIVIFGQDFLLDIGL